MITGDEAGAEEYYQQASVMNVGCGTVRDTCKYTHNSEAPYNENLLTGCE